MKYALKRRVRLGGKLTRYQGIWDAWRPVQTIERGDEAIDAFTDRARDQIDGEEQWGLFRGVSCLHQSYVPPVTGDKRNGRA